MFIFIDLCEILCSALPDFLLQGLVNLYVCSCTNYNVYPNILEVQRVGGNSESKKKIFYLYYEVDRGTRRYT